MALLTEWPKHRLPLDQAQRDKALEGLNRAFSNTIKNLQVDLGLEALFEKIYVPIACWVLEKKPEGEPLVLGINGAQGSGKARLFNLIEVVLTEAFGLRVVGLSIDDIYLTRAEREALARTVHPMLLTRGVPGTHDVQLGLRLLTELKSATDDQITRIPMFDKSTDERCHEDAWHDFQGRADVIIFDGWCMSAVAQSESMLLSPVNDLEREEDPECIWRKFVNEQLAGPYQALFSEIDLLICLKVPSMEAVFHWRAEQELKLEERVAIIYEDRQPIDPLRIMNTEEIGRFIAHYERLTRWMLEELPSRADLTLKLNNNHKIVEIKLLD